MTTSFFLHLRRAAAPAVLALGTACAGPSGKAMTDRPVQVLQQRQASQCPWRGEGAAVFDTEAAWRQALGGRDPAAVFDAPVDWSRQRVVAYTMDTQPTLGYGIELQASAVAQRGEVLRLPVRLVRPAPGSMQAMALSRPCLLLTVPRGDWRVLEVRDVDGDVLVGKAAVGG